MARSTRTRPAPVVVLAGRLDRAACPPVLREVAGLFPDSTFVVQEGAGHCPWLDDPNRFVATVAGFLDG